MENTAQYATSERIKRIHRRVQKVKISEEAGVRYMQAWEEKYYDRQEAREEGLAEGLTKGLEKGIRAMILFCNEENFEQKKTIEKLQSSFDISHEDAEKYYARFSLEESN